MSKELNDALETGNIMWDLTDLYDSPEDPKIEQDIRFCRENATELESRYSGELSTVSAPVLLELIEQLENIDEFSGKMATYGQLLFATQTNNQAIGGFLQHIKEIISQVNKQTIFFELEWNTLADEIVEDLIAAPCLAKYRHYLQNIRRYKDHQFSPDIEKQLLVRSAVGKQSWNKLFEIVFGKLQFGPNLKTEEEVLTELYNPAREVRKQAAADMTAGLQSQLHVLTHIFNTVLADKMIDDRERKFSSWVSSMNLYNELEDNTVDTLIRVVTENYHLVQQYYNAKKAILGVDQLYDYDRYAPLPFQSHEKITWPQNCNAVLQAFDNFSAELGQVAHKFFRHNWIHAPIVAGKRGGAFAHPCVPAVHPYLLVNFTGNIRDVSTVAHELGHGVHQYLARETGYYNSNTPLVLAETASVFAELLLFHDQFEQLTTRESRLAFVSQKIESIFATVFRQVAMNRFENSIHNHRREKGELRTEDFSQQWLESQSAMFGDSLCLTENYSIWWSYIPHFLSSPGYVYSYAFGELLVLSLYKLYRDTGRDFVDKYVALLKAGGSSSPYQALEPFGIDLNDPHFWQGGIAIIQEYLQIFVDLNH